MEMSTLKWLSWRVESGRCLRVVLYIVIGVLSLGYSRATFGQPNAAIEASPRTESRTSQLAAPDCRNNDFPPELVNWRPSPGNPIFTAEGPGHWDVKIRERG